MQKINDVIDYILFKTTKLSPMKLQKILYYCQAWHLVWEEEPMFENKIIAYSNGPVIEEVFKLLNKRDNPCNDVKYNDGYYGNKDFLSESKTYTIDEVLSFYGKKSNQWIKDLISMEDPWKYTKHKNEITLELLYNYYSKL